MIESFQVGRARMRESPEGEARGPSGARDRSRAEGSRGSCRLPLTYTLKLIAGPLGGSCTRTATMAT